MKPIALRSNARSRPASSRLRARPMTELSGGEAMRAHLARALAQEAPLLVLDEPTARLDPAQAVGIAEVLRAHARERRRRFVVDA